MEAFIVERAEHYVIGSRQQTIDKLAEFATGDSESSILVVIGQPGFGKSALLAKLHRLISATSGALIVSHFIGVSTGSTDQRQTLR
jgi:ABC-type proline/glycine betaine transport system ATPase subunit